MGSALEEFTVYLEMQKEYRNRYRNRTGKAVITIRDEEHLES